MAGEFTLNINRSARIAGVTIGGIDVSVFCDSEQCLSKTVPGGTVNGEFDIAVTIANVQIMAVHANQDCTVYVNAPSTGTPAATLNLKKNQLLMWNAASDPVGAKFIGVDITKLFVTTTLDTVFLFGVGVDATPVLAP